MFPISAQRKKIGHCKDIMAQAVRCKVNTGLSGHHRCLQRRGIETSISAPLIPHGEEFRSRQASLGTDGLEARQRRQAA
jgi:hypothetical protein